MSDLDLENFYFDNESVIKSELDQYDLSGLSKGKYLRSQLLALTASTLNLENKEIEKLGRVVEMVHNATLTHDDVIDNSHTRRGSPSIPSLVNNKKSVLLGDYMLARALHELSDFNNPSLTKELTLTLKELVEGEWIQYENTNPYEISSHLYETLALKKTGSLFRWCFIAPVIAANENICLELFSELGEKLGIIFQMTDDIIDFNPESKKSFGLDFRNNNINYVLHFVGINNPELKTKFLRTDDIHELNDDEKEIIANSLSLAKSAVNENLSRCKEILSLMQEKLPENQEAFLSELSSILDLVADRVF